jgi:hypothetical protein
LGERNPSIIDKKILQFLCSSSSCFPFSPLSLSCSVSCSWSLTLRRLLLWSPMLRYGWPVIWPPRPGHYVEPLLSTPRLVDALPLHHVSPEFTSSSFSSPRHRRALCSLAWLAQQVRLSLSAAQHQMLSVFDAGNSASLLRRRTTMIKAEVRFLCTNSYRLGLIVFQHCDILHFIKED